MGDIISIAKIDWSEHHTIISTDTAANMLETFVFLSQFKVLPTGLASLRESTKVAITRTMTQDELRQLCEKFRENNPEAVLFEKKEEETKE